MADPNNNLSKLMKKYDVQEDVQGVDEKPVEKQSVSAGRAEDIAAAWAESEPIVALRKYLRENPSLGATVGLVDGRVALHFSPGLVPKDADRWRAAETAWGLLVDAFDDIKSLMEEGLMRLRPIYNKG